MVPCITRAACSGWSGSAMTARFEKAFRKLQKDFLEREMAEIKIWFLVPRKHVITITWRAYEMEKPAVPGLRCVLPVAANSAANNTTPLPRNSRFVASHLQEKITELLLGALLLFTLQYLVCIPSSSTIILQCTTKTLPCSGCCYHLPCSSWVTPISPNWLACGLC